MSPLSDIKAAFAAAQARPVSPDLLQPAGPLLDLYGEDIRARAYVTQDPDLGEMMLRPDFTVPVALAHLKSGAAQARYSYDGTVFRMPPSGSSRPREYRQLGFEVFHQGAVAETDAEVFALFHGALRGQNLRPVTGDIGILLAAVASLSTTPRRRAALTRHIWRPRRFKALFERFAQVSTAAPVPTLSEAPEIGLRRRADVAARLKKIAEDIEAEPLPNAQSEVFGAILSLRANLPDALAQLQDMSVDLPGITSAVSTLARRCQALEANGIDPAELAFESSFGRTNMEYYDGFVFGFVAADRPDLPPVATGGRYDALLRRLAPEATTSAIGGVVRPEVLAEVSAP